MNPIFKILLLSSLATPLALGCSQAPKDDASCAGAKCDELDDDDVPLDTPCAQALFDRSGRGFLPKRLADDALIKHVYMDAADGCPVTMREVMEVLSEKDDANCSGTDGLVTHVVSEQARLNGTSEDASFRAVTSRTCDNREDFGLLFSTFGFGDFPGAESAGLHPGGTELPGGLEVIAFDEKNQVFNFYKEVGGRMGFFGSSTDFITQGPGGPGLTDERGCANCHEHGGLVMKELENPWLNWEERPDAGFTTFDRETPGAGELIDSRIEVLGEKGDGPRLEQAIIKPGNTAWNTRRIQFINANMDVEKLLEPLFCPTDIQIGAQFNARQVNHNFIIDTGLLDRLGLDTGGRIRTNADDYDAMLELSASQVAGTDAADVHQPMAFVARSAIDRDYTDQLVDAGIVSAGFVEDVLMIDFTRQALSNDRCDLLEFAPDLPTAERNPENIRDGFLANLANEADGTPGALLRQHLQARVDGEAFDHAATAEAFISACQTRQDNDQFDPQSAPGNHTSLIGSSAFHIDAYKLRSLGRKIVMTDGVLDNSRGSAEHSFEVFEFQDGMPFDDIDVVSSGFDADNPLEIHRRSRFSPVDCELTDEFVPAGAASGGDGGGGGVCPGECGEFVNGATCQCDDQCADFGNCCDGFEEVADACPGTPGEFVPGASCQCDDQCADFGNCCDGFEALCE